MELTYGLVSPTASYWAHYVAQERELYAAQSLTVNIASTGSTLGGADAVADGKVDISGSCPDQIILAADSGKGVVIVGGVVRRPVSAVVGRATIDSLSDLRGGRVGMSDSVGGVASLLREILRRAGLPSSEYTSVVVGGTPDQARMLEEGSIDAAMLTHPWATRLVERGCRLLASTDDYWAAYPFTTLNTRRSWAAERADTLAAFLRATIQASRWLHDPANKAEACTILARATGLPAAEIDATYARYIQRGDVLPREAGFEASELQPMLDLLLAEGLLHGNPNPSRYVDTGPWERARASLSA